MTLQFHFRKAFAFLFSYGHVEIDTASLTQNLPVNFLRGKWPTSIGPALPLRGTFPFFR